MYVTDNQVGISSSPCEVRIPGFSIEKVTAPLSRYQCLALGEELITGTRGLKAKRERMRFIQERYANVLLQ